MVVEYGSALPGAPQSSARRRVRRREDVMRTQFARLLKQMRKNFPDMDVEILRKAYRVADKAHQGQMRLSGDPYISHCLEVARILANLGLDPTTVTAGLLHDVLEDTSVTLKELEAGFGKQIASLIDGVTKMGALPKTSGDASRTEKQAANIRKMLVATVKDVRVLLIKLADRLHNMRTIEFLPPNSIERISRETLDIYAPLAHRLGIAQWKWELEDHAFHRLHPDEYKEIAARVAMKRRDREAQLKETMEFLEKRLGQAGIKARVIGRPKHFYSIHRKMLEQGIDFEQVMDIQALRIVTRAPKECYHALGVVHRLWTPVPGRFKDYVAMPKPNRYQSIHTTVMRENGTALEIQIRTGAMDDTAQQGIAAHWLYKEGEASQDRKMADHLKWLRQMYEWLQETQESEDLLDSMRRDVQVSDVYVFTPKGEVKELPPGATPLDFAYLIHSDIGSHCIGARVNGRQAPFRYNLQTGDVVEILTSKKQTPRVGWLELVVTGRARTRIRQKLRELGLVEHIEADKKSTETSRPAPPPPKVRVTPVDDATREKLIRIEGAKGMAVRFAKCCNPMPGHAIVGYATRFGGITIHRRDCRNFNRVPRDSKRVIEASWEGERQVEISIRVTIGQRPNVLADITHAIRPMNIDITQANLHPAENGKSYFDFVFEAPDRSYVKRVTRTIRTVVGVSEVVSIPAGALAGAVPRD